MGCKALASYDQLARAVPESYRALASIEVKDLRIPAVRSAPPGNTLVQGTAVPAPAPRPSAPPTGRPAGDPVGILRDGKLVVTAKAILIDQKAIQSRFLRIRARAGVLLIDGFVRNAQEEALIRQKAGAISEVRRLILSVVHRPDLGAKGKYKTVVSQPARDRFLAARLGGAILAAQAHGRVPKSLHVAAVEVFQNKAKVYVIGTESTPQNRVREALSGQKGLAGLEVSTCPEARLP